MIVVAFFSVFKIVLPFVDILFGKSQLFSYFQIFVCEYLREHLHYFREHFVIFASSFRQNQKCKDEKFRSLEKIEISFAKSTIHKIQRVPHTTTLIMMLCYI